MIFNRDVLENFEESELEIVKCILFFIQEDIYINDMVTNKHHDLINDEVETLSWKDTILGDVQELVLKLRDLGIIVESYEKEKVRWKLKVPLYVDENAEPYEEKITDDLVSKCRQFFKKSYCRIAGRSGSNKTVKNALSLLLQSNPDIDVNLIPGACSSWSGKVKSNYIVWKHRLRQVKVCTSSFYTRTIKVC